MHICPKKRLDSRCRAMSILVTTAVLAIGMGGCAGSKKTVAAMSGRRLQLRQRWQPLHVCLPCGKTGIFAESGAAAG